MADKKKPAKPRTVEEDKKQNPFSTFVLEMFLKKRKKGRQEILKQIK
jgi:hypothetical protein